MKIFDENKIVKPSKKMKQFITYINTNSAQIINDPISKTAKAIACSASTINRFVTLLGFSNYNLFKIHLANFTHTFNLPKEINHKLPILQINDQAIRQIEAETTNTFDLKTLEIINKISLKLLKTKNLNIIYDIRGTFMASLLRYELNALGIHTIISKTWSDFANITNNSLKANRQNIFVFTEKALTKEQLKIVNQYNYKVLITKINFMDQIFDYKVALNYVVKSSQQKEFELSRYILHLIFINHLILLIKKQAKK